MNSLILILLTVHSQILVHHTIEYEKAEEGQLMNTEKPPEPEKHIENYFNATEGEIKDLTNLTHYDTGELKPYSELNYTKLTQKSYPLTDREIVIQKRFFPLLGLLLHGASLLVPMVIPDIIPDIISDILPNPPKTPVTSITEPTVADSSDYTDEVTENTTSDDEDDDDEDEDEDDDEDDDDDDEDDEDDDDDDDDDDEYESTESTNNYDDYESTKSSKKRYKKH